MSNQQILEQSLRKALDSGWDGYYGGNYPSAPDLLSERWEWIDDPKHFAKNFGWPECELVAYEAVIFNHDFAKALWGDKDEDCRCIACGTDYAHAEDCVYLNRPHVEWIDAWQYHLQHMVIADDPIKYLGVNADLSEKAA